MLLNFRSEFIETLVNNNHEVYVINTDMYPTSEIEKLGAKSVPLELKSNQIDLLHDFSTYRKLKKILKTIKPDIVLNYNLKPIFLGTYAAKSCGIKNIYSTITGLGYFFIDDKRKKKLSSKFVSLIYKKVLKHNTKVFFQNPDDLEEIVKESELKKKTAIVNGSGVNMEKFPFAEFPKEFSFLMVSRILKDKGILEYLKAAEIIKKKYPHIVLKLVGPFDTNPSSLKREEINKYIDKKIIQYHEETDNVYEFIKQSSVIVLPSYREGVPRVCLEAMSTGRPLLTTNVPGCRETVNESKNGFLVNPKDYVALAGKMEWFIINEESIKEMGEESFKFCKKKYEVREVNKHIICEISKSTKG